MESVCRVGRRCVRFGLPGRGDARPDRYAPRGARGRRGRHGPDHLSVAAAAEERCRGHAAKLCDHHAERPGPARRRALALVARGVGLPGRVDLGPAGLRLAGLGPAGLDPAAAARLHQLAPADRRSRTAVHRPVRDAPGLRRAGDPLRAADGRREGCRRTGAAGGARASRRRSCEAARPDYACRPGSGRRQRRSGWKPRGRAAADRPSSAPP